MWACTYVGDITRLALTTGEPLSWTRMPTGCDCATAFGHGLDVTIPSGLQEYRRLLTSLFPRSESDRRYCTAAHASPDVPGVRRFPRAQPPLFAQAASAAGRAPS